MTTATTEQTQTSQANQTFSHTLGCPLECPVPVGVHMTEIPAPRHDFADVIHCPNDHAGCARAFLVSVDEGSVAEDPGDLDEPCDDNMRAAAARVDFRLSYDSTDEPRRLHGWGINGPEIKNSYYGRGLDDTDRPEFSSGDWEDPDHPPADATEDEHIEAWFGSAVREAVHEALEWFWVDGKMYLSPHGKTENAIHHLSGVLVAELLALRQRAVDEATEATAEA